MLDTTELNKERKVLNQAKYGVYRRWKFYDGF